MVSLWHAFDFTASLQAADLGVADLGAAEVGQVAASPRVASRARLAPSFLRTELLSADEMRRHEALWHDLAGRALVPNLFFEPEFALAAATHLAPAQAPRFLLIFDERGHPASRLVLVAPLLASGFGVGEAKLWVPEPMLSSTPLIDRDTADIAIDAMFEAVRSGPARASGLLLPRLEEGGIFAGLVRQSILRSGRNILRFARPLDQTGLSARQAPPAHDRVVAARGARQVREAVEQFLAIEALGPSGRSGEALLLSPSASAFVRVVTRSLARKRRCRVELYLSNGKPVGGDITLRSGETEMLWKTARSEAPLTDGVAEPSAAVTVDWLVAARPGRSPAMLALAARDHFGRRLRMLVKRVVRKG
ncbi:Acetyltransferase (GNAT) domain-containing protein [Rhizobiales bacterium GAS191]|nr:Acetyltransferase (GNAT) domain-containing protein [Rhizobiales bacterium GAS191]